jgi:hypothetical protein
MVMSPDSRIEISRATLASYQLDINGHNAIVIVWDKNDYSGLLNNTNGAHWAHTIVPSPRVGR